MTFIDIAVGFNDLFQRVAAVDDRFEISSLDQFFEEHEVGDRFAAAGCLNPALLLPVRLAQILQQK